MSVKKFARRSEDGQGTQRRRNIAESFNPWVGCTNVKDRQTGGFAMANTGMSRSHVRIKTKKVQNLGGSRGRKRRGDEWRRGFPCCGGVFWGGAVTPSRTVFNLLNENGVFRCTLEHCFKVDMPATEGIAPHVHALRLQIFRRKIKVCDARGPSPNAP